MFFVLESCSIRQDEPKDLSNILGVFIMTNVYWENELDINLSNISPEFIIYQI